jgi:peptidoglycan LD-endopeptidase LytH
MTAPATAAEDPGVATATSKLLTAQQHAAALTRILDEAAQSYERANAHRIRLGDEALESTATLERAAAAVDDAESELRRRVTAAYKRPGPELALTDAILHAPDAGSALHRAALFSRFTHRSAENVTQVRWAAALTQTDVTQERVIAAGAQASVEEWKDQSDRLRDALDAAQREVLAAEDGVESAKAEAQRRAEAAEAARVAAAAVGGAPWSTTAPPHRVNGKTCPVGTPNGFIDSWGYPRSGGRGHQGVDMFAPMGTPLYAVAEGTIYRVYTNTLGGLAINLIDNAGDMYYYAHLSAAYVTSGQKVGTGQVIGAVGDSGNARGTPPHLHWQYHPGNGAPVNPYPLAHALCRG